MPYVIKPLEGRCSLRRKSVQIPPSSRKHCPVPTVLIDGLYTCVSEILNCVKYEKEETQKEHVFYRTSGGE